MGLHVPPGGAGPGRWQEAAQRVAAVSARATLPPGGERWWAGSRAWTPLHTSHGVPVPPGHCGQGSLLPFLLQKSRVIKKLVKMGD